MTTNITVRVNEKKLIANLGYTFSNSHTVLSELMQNARRAKATKVVISFLEPDILVVQDDGEGISNFADLLHIAESGWNQATQDSEEPFGMGWISCLFAAKHVIVQSHGQKIAFDTADAINQQAIKIEKGIVQNGTIISLSGFRMSFAEIEKRLKRLASGFPIPVYLNTVELPRPYAEESLGNIVSIPGGKAWLNKRAIDNYFRFRGKLSIRAFLQGLPIYDDFSYNSEKAEVILYLDPKVYKPRMPDRDTLIDAEKHTKTFTEIGAGLVKSYLLEKKEKLSPDEFVKYWDVAEAYGFLDIFNDVPVLPASILRTPNIDPIAIKPHGSEDDNFTEYKDNVRREDVESGKVVLCGFDRFYVEEANPANWVLASQLGWINVASYIPDEHWAKPFIKFFKDFCSTEEGEDDGDEIEVIAEPFGVSITGSFSEGWVSINNIILCEGYKLTTKDGQYSVTVTDVSVVTALDGQLTTIVPKGDVYPGWIVEQHCDYICDDDYHEADRDNDSDAFNGYIAAMRGEPVEVTLKKILTNGGIGNYPTLNGKSLQVTVSDSGEITISPV